MLGVQNSLQKWEGHEPKRKENQTHKGDNSDRGQCLQSIRVWWRAELSPIPPRPPCRSWARQRPAQATEGCCPTSLPTVKHQPRLVQAACLCLPRHDAAPQLLHAAPGTVRGGRRAACGPAALHWFVQRRSTCAPCVPPLRAAAGCAAGLTAGRPARGAPPRQTAAPSRRPAPAGARRPPASPHRSPAAA